MEKENEFILDANLIFRLAETKQLLELFYKNTKLTNEEIIEDVRERELTIVDELVPYKCYQFVYLLQLIVSKKIKCYVSPTVASEIKSSLSLDFANNYLNFLPILNENEINIRNIMAEEMLIKTKIMPQEEKVNSKNDSYIAWESKYFGYSILSNDNHFVGLLENASELQSDKIEKCLEEMSNLKMFKFLQEKNKVEPKHDKTYVMSTGEFLSHYFSQNTIADEEIQK